MKKGPSVKKVAEVVKATMEANDAAATNSGQLLATQQTPETLINNTLEKMGAGKRNPADNPAAAKLLATLDPGIIAINHINGILSVASRYSTKLGPKAVGVQEYRKILIRLAGTKNLDERKYNAGRHLKVWETILITYKPAIMEGSLDWIGGGKDKELIEIPFLKTKGVIPLTAIYEILNTPGAEDSVVKDATNFESHVWAIFSCVTNSETEKELFRKNADECRVDDTTTEAFTNVSLKIRDRVLATTQAQGNQPTSLNDVMPIVNGLVGSIQNDKELRDALDGVKQVFDNGGTLDFQAIAKAIGGAANLPQTDDNEETESVDRANSAPLSCSSSSSSSTVSAAGSKELNK